MDALTHSERCDQFFGKLSDIPGGESHTECLCWCHNEIDGNERPEYAMEAPAPEALPEEFTDISEISLEEWQAIRETVDACPIFAEQPDDPLCDLCDDPMSKCECVE